MKKRTTMLAVALTAMCVGIVAQTTRTEAVDPELTYFGLDKAGRQVDGNFEDWMDEVDADGNVTGRRMLWWQVYNGDAYKPLTVTPTLDRNGEEKAIKILTNHPQDWLSWHVCIRNTTATYPDDFWTISINQGEDFYYTFWAKGEVGGEKLWIGCSQLYDPAWETMPSVTLTTEWRQYGIQAYATKPLNTFHIQPRGVSGTVYYLDDLVINWGTDMPPLSISSPEEDDRTMTICSNGNKSATIFTLAQGEITISDLSGKTVQTIEVDSDSKTVELPTEGVYFFTFKSAEKSFSKKVVID